MFENKKFTIYPTKAGKNKKLLAHEKLWDSVLENLLHISTINAVERIFHKSSKIIERLLWSFGFVMASIVFIYVTWNIGYIYRFKPLKTVISDLQLPIFRIPFPDVTICNKNRLNWQRYEEAKAKFLHTQHHNNQHEQLFIDTLNAYDTLKFGHFGNFRNISNIYPPILLRELNYINFTSVTELMAWRCDEIFSECSWINQTVDCCEIFGYRKSQLGHCLAFNSIETEEGRRLLETDPYYPRHTMTIGQYNGLKLRIHIREKFHSPLHDDVKGILVMLVEPHVWSYIPYDIATNTRTSVSVSAALQFYDETTRMFTPDVRNCVFEDELNSVFYKSLQYHKYMYENCQSECQQEHLMKFCNCTVDMFYPPGQYPSCRLTDLPCLYQHNNVLQNIKQVGEQDYVAQHEEGMNCPCYFNCKSLSYSADINVDNIPSERIEANNSEIEISVFFLWATLTVYKTTAVYTFIDLMASFGGLAGLCIGCSLMGLVEVLYFFLVAVPKRIIVYYGARKRLKHKRRRLKAKHVLVREFARMP